MKLYLVRHGESAWNQLHVYTGQQDVPLSDLGKQQAQRLAEHLRQVRFAEIYTSPLQRARETARPLAELQGMSLREDARLAEIHHGAWEGNPAALVREQFADSYYAWRTQPHTAQMPEGESLEQVAHRVQQFLQDLLAAHEKDTVLVATHDAVLRVIVLQVLQIGLPHFWHWRFDNASLSIIERTEDGPYRLALLNDAHYLEGVRSDCTTQAL